MKDGPHRQNFGNILWNGIDIQSILNLKIKGWIKYEC
jgi:hypothetical protein